MKTSGSLATEGVSAPKNQTQDPHSATKLADPNPTPQAPLAAAKTSNPVASQNKNNRPRLPQLLSILVALLGVALLLYPVIATRVNNANQQQLAEEYRKSIKQVPQSQRDKALKSAEKYNRDLVAGVILDPFLEDARPDTTQYQQYLKELSITDIISQVSVPAAKIKLPVYHGTEDDILAKGAGHLFGSSLPVGGKSTHTVLTGHTGLSTATLFDNLIDVKKGDAIYLDTLGRKMKYRVFDISVVLPTETEKLATQPGKDLITLITCTPYAVNSHRLLVTGERVPLDPKDGEAFSGSDNPWQWWMILLVSLAILSTLAIGGLLARLYWLQKKRNEEEENEPAQPDPATADPANNLPDLAQPDQASHPDCPA